MEVLKPNRVSHTYRQIIHAPAKTIFPLYCPVREAEWIDGWDPTVVYSESGVAEKDCVFVTEQGDLQAVWVVTVHDPESFRVEMLKVTPGMTVCKIQIQLEQIDTKETAAFVRYEHTSLGPDGDEFIDSFTAEHYEEFMTAWEQAMNGFLSNGA